MNLQTSNGQVKESRHIRQSNIEILRIVAMLGIVAYHFVVHSGLNLSGVELGINIYWLKFIRVFGKVGIDVLVLISGFFLVQTDRIRTGKLLKLWMQVFFYSIVSSSVSLGLTEFSSFMQD